MRTFVLTALLAAAPLASAASVQEAQTLLDTGHWQEAVSMAAGLNSSAGYALAAEATTLGATTVADTAKKAMFQRAQGYANQAIKLDANNARAYFELARADGRLAQFSGILQSLGLAGDVKTALNKALALDPKLAGAYVALGLWNGELVGKGFIARQATGADANQIVPNFEKAISLEPTVLTHHYEYANALLAANSKRNRAAAIAQLQLAVALKPTTYWEEQDLKNAQAKLASLR
ncbi:hypothetical protein [Deinococcus sonorensis]|uniref:Tetratricopeptide repeat protein n=2 Tax=Deinococcus sonorensis TaxID=309891 RepID=A0AAU7U9R6_9DEIO